MRHLDALLWILPLDSDTPHAALAQEMRSQLSRRPGAPPWPRAAVGSLLRALERRLACASAATAGAGAVLGYAAEVAWAEPAYMPMEQLRALYETRPLHPSTLASPLPPA